jgi:GDP-L-fucose synthase
VWGSGNDVRDLIYIDDFVDALILAAEKINVFNPINIGLGKGYTVKEILNMALEIEEYSNADVRYDPAKPSMIPVRLIDVSKAERVLGFRAKTEVKEGIAKTIEWYKERTDGRA